MKGGDRSEMKTRKKT